MKHPYSGVPDNQIWGKERGIEKPAMLDPVSEVPFRIDRRDKIVTAGSCFAQHVTRFMTKAGFNHHVTEAAHPIVPKNLALRHNYGMFAARYGNIYTARQLRQLLQRAYGEFTPQMRAWALPENRRVVDPFRPQVQPGGFLSEAELEADRCHHFRCIRDAIKEMDVFVFTLGLTEGWADCRDGAVFPVAPGVHGGVYDPATVRFVNFDEAETYADLKASIEFIRRVNPAVRIILTVSPVPLNATYEDRHVLVSTVWSKSVLRIAAEKATREFADCAYFPSYEVVTSPHVRGRYFAEDCREVTPKGVRHVMDLFMKHYTDGGGAIVREARDIKSREAARHHREMEKVIQALCDEAGIDNG